MTTNADTALTAPLNRSRFPFRLGTTSYIYPANIAHNVIKLQDDIDDIELLFFEVEDESDLPDANGLVELRQIAEESDLTYTVHLPLDLFLGDFDETCRKHSVEKALKVIRGVESLQPFAFNAHFEKRNADHSPVTDIARWQENLRRSSETLANAFAQPELFSVEYLNYPFELIRDIIDSFNFSYVLDLGHLLLQGGDYMSYLKRYLDKTRVIHLHGVAEDKDHLSLEKGDAGKLAAIFDFLQKKHYRNVLTLEIFNKRDLDESLRVVERLCKIKNKD